jgi:hypothetical protein
MHDSRLNFVLGRHVLKPFSADFGFASMAAQQRQAVFVVDVK